MTLDNRHPMYTVFLLFIISMFMISGFIVPTILLLLTWGWAASGIPAVNIDATCLPS